MGLIGGYAYSKFGGEMAALNALDPGAKKVYGDMWTKLKETGTSADATVWKKQIAEDAAEAMSSVATELNIKRVRSNGY